MVIFNSKQRWLPADVIVTNAEGARSQSDYLEVLDQFKVETNPRYTPENGQTFCNIFVWDASRAMGAEVPHWVKPDGSPGTHVFPSEETTANKLFDWFPTHGVRFGWSLCGPTQAQASANAGNPTVAVWKNPRPGASGHVAMVVPGEWQYGGPWVMQAGRINYRRAKCSQAFGAYTPYFWTHA